MAIKRACQMFLKAKFFAHSKLSALAFQKKYKKTASLLKMCDF